MAVDGNAPRAAFGFYVEPIFADASPRAGDKVLMTGNPKAHKIDQGVRELTEA
jgi:hypothetical protein